MPPLTLSRVAAKLAFTTAVAIALNGCDSGSPLLITEPLPSDAAATEIVSTTAIDTELAEGESASANPDGSSPDGGNSVAVDSVVIVSEAPDNDASSGAVASAHIADRASLGPIKIMAVGDGITHGVAGASSYRKHFTSLMQAASCDFTMVGSQTTSSVQGSDSNCIDIDVIGDGWGWNGSEACVIDNAPDADVFPGAHEGYSGNRADHFLTSYDSSAGFNAGIRVAIQDYVPDVVLLHIGSVDLYNHQTVGSTVNDIDNLLNAIYETKPDTLVLIANVIPWFGDRPYAEISERIQLLGDGIQEVVAERYDPMTKLVDVRTGFTESMMTDDLHHPNVAGENHIAEAFMSVYEPLANCS